MLSSYLAHLAVERGLAANTLASYRRDLHRYVEHLRSRGRVTLGEVGEADVLGLPRRAARGRRATTRPSWPARPRGRSPPSAACTASRCARASGRTTRRTRCDPPRQLRRLPKAISVDEVERLIAASGPDGAPLTLRNRALLEVLYGTGARISEAVGLAVDDVTEAGARYGCAARAAVPASCPLGRYARAGARRLPRPGPARHRRPRPGHLRALPQRQGRAAHPAGRLGGAPGRRRASRTRRDISAHVCGIPSQPTSSTAEPTLGWSRSCSATPR